jgi:hypothetical protein
MTGEIACDIVAPVRALDLQAAFREAVLDLAAEPTPTNVRRYLAASQLLEVAAQRAVSRARRRPASTGTRR